MLRYINENSEEALPYKQALLSCAERIGKVSEGDYFEECFLMWCVLQTKFFSAYRTQADFLQKAGFHVNKIGLRKTCYAQFVKAYRDGTLKDSEGLSNFLKGLVVSDNDFYYLFAAFCILYPCEYALINQFADKRNIRQFINYSFAFPCHTLVMLGKAQKKSVLNITRDAEISYDGFIREQFYMEKNKPFLSTGKGEVNRSQIVPGVTVSPKEKTKALIVAVIGGWCGFADLYMGYYLRFFIKFIAFSSVVSAVGQGVDFNSDTLLYLIVVFLSLLILIWNITDIVFIGKRKKYDGKNRLITDKPVD